MRGCLGGLAHLHLAPHLVLRGWLIFILRSILCWGVGSSSSCAPSCLGGRAHLHLAPHLALILWTSSSASSSGLAGIDGLWTCGLVDWWACGLVDLWTCGLVDLWTCGLVDLWTCGPVDLWTCGLVDLRTCGLVDLVEPVDLVERHKCFYYIFV